jgi:peptide-methionine (S)-S-oxide reductase
VVRTRVGYAGGTKKNPTYHDLGNHTESIQIDYDPAVISYEKLLTVFWNAHNPYGQSWSRQYLSIIFFHNDKQKRLATVSREREEARTKARISTEILPFTGFYRAEDYHQKYRLRSERDLMSEFRAMYPAEEDFMNSTAAARINGYLDGYGTLEDLLEELPGLGLSPAGAARLTEIVKRRKGMIACTS